MSRWAMVLAVGGSSATAGAAAVYVPVAAIGAFLAGGVLLFACPGAGVAFGWSGFVLVAKELPAGWGLGLSAGFLVAIVVAAGPLSGRRIANAVRTRSPELALGGCVLLIATLRPTYIGAEDRPLQLLYGLYLAVVITIVVSNQQRRLQYLTCLAVVGAIIGASELARVLGGGDQHSEIVALGLNPIDLGRLCGLGVVAAVLVVIVGKQQGRLFLIPIATLAMAGTVASGSRGPFLAIVLALLYGFAARSSSHLVSRIAGLGAVGMVVLYLVSQTSDRVVTPALDGDVVRLEAWRVAITTALENPIVGAGFGYFWRSNGVPLVVQFPHNLFLEAGAELGLVAIVLVGLGAVRAWKIGDLTERSILIFSAVCVSVSGNLGQSHLWWAAVGLAGAARLGELQRTSKGGLDGRLV